MIKDLIKYIKEEKRQKEELKRQKEKTLKLYRMIEQWRKDIDKLEELNKKEKNNI